MIDKMKKQVRQFCLVKQHRLNGLVVWFLLRVQEVPGSNPGWAPIIFSIFDCECSAITLCLHCFGQTSSFKCVCTWREGCALNMQCYKDKNREHPCKKFDPKNSIDIQAELTYGEKTLLRRQPKSFVSIFPHLWLMAIIAWNFHCKHIKDQLGPPWETKNPHFLLKASLGLPCTFLKFLL